MCFDVIGFGALNVDKLYKVNRIARGNEESIVTGFSESCGGSAANTIVGLSKLGLKTGFIGKVAKDREGELQLNEFDKWNVDTTGIVKSDNGRSGQAIGFVDQDGERALYIDPGVNDELGFEEIDIELVKGAEFLHLSSFVGDKQFSCQSKIINELHNSVKISIDPGILYARKGLSSLKPILGKSRVAIPNEVEVELLTGEDYENGSQTLLDEGLEIVAVKLGERGCYITNGNEDFLLKPPEVEVIDTTGAGDAFSAGFIYGLTQGRTLRECGEIGNFVASQCIQKVGAREGLPKKSKIRNFVDD